MTSLHDCVSKTAKRLSLIGMVMIISVGLVASSCGGGSNSGAAAAKDDATPVPAAAQATAAEQSAYPESSLTADALQASVGTKVTLTGTEFPSDTDVALTWKTFDGSFLLEQEEVVFVGPRYEERIVDLGTVTTSSTGAFEFSFNVPEDFGGSHDIVARVEDEFATKMGFTVQPSFSVSAMSGPIGMPLEITAKGLGYRTQLGLWQVSWDNGFTGYLTAVTTRGTAVGRIRLAGPPGPHVLKIWRNFRGIPYLNPHQGPFGALPEPTTFVIDVKDDVYDASAVWAHPEPQETVRATPAVENQGGASLSVTPDQGTVGSEITIIGVDFPANQSVTVTWASRAGQKITAEGLLEGFEEKLSDLSEVTTGSDGRFELKLTVPQDFGGYHRITATSGDHVAEAYFSIFASIEVFTERAKVGEDITINMNGVGWTIQGKTYAVVYDNHYLGYGCSFSTRGEIDLHLPAAGSPGLHIIDLYPAVYDGLDPSPDIYSSPNLTYLDDHPNGALPAFRLMVEIVE